LQGIKFICLFVVNIQIAILPAYPNIAIPVLKKRIDVICAKAVTFGSLSFKINNLVRLSIQEIEAAASAAQPKLAILILDNCLDKIIEARQTIICLALESDEAIFLPVEKI